MTRVLIVGGGGREHALAWACARDRDDVELITAPGNGGTAAIGENVDVAPTDAPSIARLATGREVDLVVIGPDAAVAAGVADACTAAGVSVFGPSLEAGRIESSKSFAKALMRDAGIPTPRWVTGGRDDKVRLRAFIADTDGRCVVKADGLALGKGVVVCATVDNAEAALTACLDEGRFGVAGARVVLEERLHGDEVSVLALCDGSRLRVLVPSRDYKRAHDAGTGPNTGGMGAVAPPPDVETAPLIDDVVREVLTPCIETLALRGTPFVGCLYAGLMLTDSGVRVLEYNARFGDPEAQVVLPLLGEPFLDLMLACARGDVTPGVAERRAGAAVGVVVAAGGYPGPVDTGAPVDGLDALDGDVLCFHAATRREPDGSVRTTGGRVLSVVAVDADPERARDRAYENVRRVRFDGAWYRGDIALSGVEA